LRYTLPHVIGRSVRRREDRRLLTGRGQFIDDIPLVAPLQVVFVRSPHAHARIRSLATAAAAACEGVSHILTGGDVADLGPLGGHLWAAIPPPIEAWLRPRLQLDSQPLLAVDRVRFIGEPVAAVVARSRALAEDAAQAVEVDYEPLPALTTPSEALAADAPPLDPTWSDNIALHLHGTVGEVDAAFKRATARASLTVRLGRQTGVPMETRGLAALFDARAGELTIWSNTQVPHVLRDAVAETLGLAAHRVRVISVDVGGGFGIKGLVYAEDILVPLLAMRTQRAVKWIEDRREHFMASIHARDQTHTIDLAADEDGRVLGVRDRFVVDIGAYNPLRLTSGANTVAHLVGPYRVPALEVDGRVVVTNKTTAAPYRGAGRPEAVWAMERGLDRLARAAGLDPVELRRRNTLTAAEMPWDTHLYYRDGQPLVYDSGDYLACLERALDLVGYAEFRAAQRVALARGEYLGLGVAGYIEGTGIGPFEGALVRVDGTGKVVVYTGACSQGQGHETVFAQVCAEVLGVAFADVTVIGGDTAGLSYGWGTIASRSTVVAGSAIREAAATVRDKACRVAADLLEVAPADVVLADGVARVSGAPARSVSLRQIAEACAPQRAQPAGREPGLEALAHFRPETVTIANGVHAATVRVDPETGAVSILRYVVVHDCGRLVNPLLAEGQICGGVAQGIGGALFEEIVHGEAGQLLSGTLMDYALPRAADVPPVWLDHLESPSPRNPLGVKGLGEGGAIPGPAVLANAVEDALQPLGLVVQEAPLTPARVRALIAQA
jgi:aerobic carbon-monoxide dehydrogenase large subunit